MQTSPWKQRLLELKAAGLTYPEIGGYLGLTISSISGIATGRSKAPTGDPCVRLYLLHKELVDCATSQVPEINIRAPSTFQRAIRAAVAHAGGQGSLARSIRVNRRLVSQWCSGSQPIHPEHCLQIECATGVPCEELAPFVIWERDDAGAVTGYRARFAPASAPSAEAA